MTRTAERIVRRKVIARDCDYERNSMYEEGRGRNVGGMTLIRRMKLLMVWFIPRLIITIN